MPRNLHYHQQECDSLFSRIESSWDDPDAILRLESALELQWNDIPSLIELAEDMREMILMDGRF